MKLFFTICGLFIFINSSLGQQFKQGDIFLSQENWFIQWRDSNGMLIKNIYNPDGASGNFNGIGLRIHPLTGELWATNPNSNQNAIRIIKKDGTQGGTIDIYAYQHAPTSITFDSKGNAFVGGQWNDGQVVKINSGSSAIQDHFTLSTDGYISGPKWVEMDFNDSIIYYTNSRPKIKQYNVVTHQQLPDFADLTGLTSGLLGMRFLPDSTVLVVSADSVVFRLNRVGAILQTYIPTNPCGMDGIAVTADGKSFWIGGGAANAPIYKFDIRSGVVQASFATGQTATIYHGIEVYDDKKTVMGTDCSKAYPNPSNGIFKLQTKLIGTISVAIFNGIGQLVFKNDFNLSGGNNEIPLSLEKLSEGIYIIDLFDHHNHCFEKIVIQR